MKIFLIGFMGSGKTHWGKILGERLMLPFFDLDEQIINQENMSINKIFAEKGEEYFRRLEQEILHILTTTHQSFIISCGGGTPCFFNNIDYMNDNGITVWLNTNLEVLYDRLIKEKQNRPLLKDLEDFQVKQFITKKFSERRIYYEQAHLIIDEENVNTDLLIQQIMHV